jgi:bifunctional non-homologous end joining protein LigD
MNPSEKRLALLVEDHPLEYIEFEGIIPEGDYGAGDVIIWDRGPYELIERGNEKITFFLGGEKLKGAFTLTRLKGRGKENEWLLIKKKDQHALSDWELKTSLTPERRGQLRERIPPCETS